MRRIASLMAGAGLLVSLPAQAETLKGALAKAYRDNPTITAGRAQQRANDENVPIARASGLPTFGTRGGYSQNLIRGGNSLTNPEKQLTGFAGIDVPIFNGGLVRNSVRAAETRVEAGQANLRATEAATFTDVVGAYNNVIRDEAIVSLNTQNIRVLDTNLRASRDRFEVGDLTRTDVAQSQARLSLARAQLQQAQAQLISSRETYIALVGDAPGTLEPPPPLPPLPATSDAAVEIALADNPNLIAAQRQRQAADFDIAAARGRRLPQIGVTVGQNYNNFLGTLGAGQGFSTRQSGSSTVAGVNFNLPIFQGGRVGAQIRQAQALRSQSIEQATLAERQVIAQTRSAFAIYKSSQEVIQSAQAAVDANTLSLEGVRAENSVGNRTILDILNAEQELLNAQVTLVTARRDAYVAGFALLAAMGQAEAQDLALDTAATGPLYDPTIHYKQERRRYNDFASGKSAEPIARSTKTTTAQDATVTQPLDPAVSQPVDRNIVDPAGTPPK